MTVTRIAETPRVTKPYTDETWAAIRAAGEHVDAALARQNMRLTMGGEPTFVAASDREAPEWNTDALGPTKRAYASRLLRRLIPLWSKGAVIHTAQGKQYPGEPLPRFALSAHWRLDGEPVWRDAALLASDDDTDDATHETAAHFAASLAERLQVPSEMALTAQEDMAYYRWRESRLPANVTTEASKLADRLERTRFTRLFRDGLSRPTGTVLPLCRVVQGGQRRWQSARWFFRGDTLFLTPGDAPMGLRLPLASLPWMDPAELALETDSPADPFAPEAKLPPMDHLRAKLGDLYALPADQREGLSYDAAWNHVGVCSYYQLQHADRSGRVIASSAGESKPTTAEGGTSGAF